MTKKDDGLDRRSILLSGASLFAFSMVGASAARAGGQAGEQAAPAPAASSGSKPNILVIWGDDIGQGNISAYTKGLMGYRRPISTGWPMRA